MSASVHLKVEREKQRKTAAAAAEYLGISEDMVRRYDSGRSDITLRQAERYAEFLGKQLGDVLPGSKVRAPEMQPLLAALADYEANERAEVVEHLARNVAFLSTLSRRRETKAAAIPAATDSASIRITLAEEPAPKKGPPLIAAADFIEGDYDWPRPWHALVRDEEPIERAAGPLRDGSPGGTPILHSIRDIRSERIRVIRVIGESMAPRLRDGWKALIDTANRKPRGQEIAAVYVYSTGSALGVIKHENGRTFLTKENPDFAAIELTDEEWIVEGVLTKVVEAEL